MGVMYFLLFWQLIQNFIGVFGWDIWNRALVLFPWWIFPLACDIGKAVLLLAFLSLGACSIQRAVSE